MFLMQGNTIVVGRKSPHSLYNEKIASFEDDEGLYDQKDAAGFIKLQVSMTIIDKLHVSMQLYLLDHTCYKACCAMFCSYVTLNGCSLC